MINKKPLVLIMAFVFCGCLQTRREMEAQEEKQVFQTQISTLQKTKVDADMRIQDIEGQFRSLNGKLESLDNKIDKIAAQQKAVDGANGEKNKELAEQMKAYEEEITKLRERMTALETELQAAKAAEASGKKDKDSKEKAAGGEKNSYQQAEELFSKKDWKNAIVGYQKYRDKNATGKKYADATYKMGVCFEELGMQSEAKVFFDEVVEKFGKSPEARKARFRLSKLR
jgi:TolA-binding protein